MKKILLLVLTAIFTYSLPLTAAAEETAPTETAVEVLAETIDTETAKRNEAILETVALINAERAKESLSPLTLDYRLCLAAQVRAEEATKSFSHIRPNGTRCFTVLAEAGITYHSAGENLAGHFQTTEAAVKAWMASPTHKENILSPKYSRIGMGYVAEGNYQAIFFIG